MVSGNLVKMTAAPGETVQYALSLGESRVALNPLLGQALRLEYRGVINCCACGRVTKKSYSQGHCFPCSQRLASCDLCIMKPESCHYAAGTCREPEWGESHCMQPHYVYLANTSGVKVGITRASQIPTRWIDQGATQALPIFLLQSRYQSGLIEVIAKAHMADRTDWRRMLKGVGEPLDLPTLRDELFTLCREEFDAFRREQGDAALEALPQAEVLALNYPVEHYPQKVTALNLDKAPTVEGTLLGIKGQYLILDCGVLNVRKFTGYQVAVEF